MRYNCMIEYLPGKISVCVDLLSRSKGIPRDEGEKPFEIDDSAINFNHLSIGVCIIEKWGALTNRIINIIISCRQHGYPWPSLATSLYRSSPLAGLQGYIPYPDIAAVCMFELVVLLLLGHMWGSIGVHHLWARPCFSSSVLHVWFV